MSALRGASSQTAALSLLMGLLGQSLAADGGNLIGLYAEGKETLRRWARKDPIDANLGFILGATALFYTAEKGINPKVNTVGDALIYITTCLSVGYSDIFARTEAGKLIGSVAMTLGPRLAASILDDPDPTQASRAPDAQEPRDLVTEDQAAPPRLDEPTTQALVAQLDALLAALKPA